jgi:hypothetical protein
MRDPAQLKLPFQDKPPRPDLGGLSHEERLAKSQRFASRLQQVVDQIRQKKAKESTGRE